MSQDKTKKAADEKVETITESATSVSPEGATSPVSEKKPYVFINTILGTKGGVGKSTTAVHLVDWLKENGLSPKLIDLDWETGTFSRYWPEAEKITSLQTESLDDLVEKAMHMTEGHSPENPGVMVIDLRGGSGDEVLDWFSEVPFSDLAAEGIVFIAWGCITTDPDSRQTVARWFKALAGQVSWNVLVRNAKDGEVPYTPIALDIEDSISFLDVPALDPKVMARINSKCMPLGQILKLNDREKGLTDVMMRTRLKRYRYSLFAQIDAFKDKIAGL